MGNVYLLVLTDHCSDHCSKWAVAYMYAVHQEEWAVAYTLLNEEAITVAKKLIDEFFC